MIAHVNVFTNNVGFSGFDIDLGFTLLPKNRIKKYISDSMDKWFKKGKNVYAYTNGKHKEDESHIVRIFFFEK